MKKRANEIRRVISGARTFLIITHVRPDGDAISSSIAMYLFLTSIGKSKENIDVFIPNSSNDLKFIDSKKVIKTKLEERKYDVAIVVDCSNYVRTEGFNYTNFAEKTIVIDHHEALNFKIDTKYALLDPKAASCTCILFREFKNCVSKINMMDFLRCITIGILSDTIGLTINVTEESKSILEYNEKNEIDISKVKKELLEVDERTKELIELAFKRYSKKKGISCTYIMQGDLKDDEKDLKLINHKSIIEKVMHEKKCETLILLMENDQKQFKGSIRTTLENVKLNEICNEMIKKNLFLQGGGHDNSVGFKVRIENLNIKESAESTFNLVINAILNN